MGIQSLPDTRIEYHLADFRVYGPTSLDIKKREPGEVALEGYSRKCGLGRMPEESFGGGSVA